MRGRLWHWRRVCGAQVAHLREVGVALAAPHGAAVWGAGGGAGGGWCELREPRRLGWRQREGMVLVCWAQDERTAVGLCWRVAGDAARAPVARMR